MDHLKVNTYWQSTYNNSIVKIVHIGNLFLTIWSNKYKKIKGCTGGTVFKDAFLREYVYVPTIKAKLIIKEQI